MDTNIFYPCEICPKQFKSKIFLRRHARRTHEKIPVFCGQCNLPFARRDSLKRHERTVHAKEKFENLKREGLLVDIPEIFTFHECVSCGRKYNVKEKLKRHILERHVNSKLLKCAHCSAEFRRKAHLIAHLNSKHNNGNVRSSPPNYACLLCGVKFRAVLGAREHYTKAHQIILHHEKLKFDSVGQFKNWKMAIEQSTICRYVPKNKNNFEEFSRTLYRCNKSGNDLSKRKLKLKSHDSTKLNGFCPAEITVTVKHEDNSCLVSYWKTHVGHQVSDENQRIHIYLRKEDSQSLKSQNSVSGIVEEGTRKQPANELDPLTRYDLRNIFKAYRTNHSLHDQSGGEFDTEKFVKKHADSVVFYKRASEPDTTYEMLKDEDLVLIVIDEEQSKILQQHAHNVVALDCARGTKPGDFTLHSLMVVDDDGWEIAAAFMLTSRNDQSVIDIFLTFIFDTYGGPIETNCLMTDMLRERYYASWNKIMSEPKFRLMCTWRVVEAWQQNLLRIENAEEREIVQRKLRELINEPSETQFEDKLYELLTDANPNLETFLDYFKVTYVNCVESWAFCFRQPSRTDVRIRADAFNDLVEFVLAGGEHFPSVAHCLYRLDKYMALKYYGRATSSGLKRLKERHRTALAHLENATVTAGEEKNEWFVSSCREKGENETVMEMFVVQERVPKECGDSGSKCSLLCVECVSCVHEFNCSCSDASVEGNMCEHIHALCLYLRGSIVKHPDEMVDVLLDESASIPSKENVNELTTDWPAERRRCSLFSVMELKTETNTNVWLHKNNTGKLNERKRSTLEKCFRIIDAACSDQTMDTIDEIIASIEPILRRLPAK